MNDIFEVSYLEVVSIVKSAHERTFSKINEELILMYREIGKFISTKLQDTKYGEKFIDGLAEFFAKNYSELKGFNRRGLYRMKQFYEIYAEDEKVSTMLTQLSWSNHLKIMSSCKSREERFFYIKLCIKEKYTARELARQIDSCYYERYMLTNTQKIPALTNRITKNIFLDTYALEFLNLPTSFAERDFRKSIIYNLKKFILEVGKDFTFIGEEYRLQVGNRDFYIDLLFFHRTLSCLVAFELKTDEFKPEYVGKMGLYLEVLDKKIKKEDENPSVGIILCAKKDDEVVELALSRSLSPTMVSEYKLKLIDKKLLQNKLKEFLKLKKREE